MNENLEIKKDNLSSLIDKINNNRSSLSLLDFKNLSPCHYYTIIKEFSKESPYLEYEQLIKTSDIATLFFELMDIYSIQQSGAMVKHKCIALLEETMKTTLSTHLAFHNNGLYLKSKNYLLLNKNPLSSRDIYNLVKDLIFPYIIYEFSKAEKDILINSIVKDLIVNGVDNKIIQASNIYIDNGKVKVGSHPTLFPKFIVNRKYIKNSTIPKEFLDLLRYLTNDNDNDIKYLIDFCTLPLINDPDKKSGLGRFLYMYGKAGVGKSTLANIISTMLGSKNIANASNLDDSFNRHNVLNSLFAEINDKSDFLTHKICENIKAITSCDFTSSRALYKSSESSRPITTLMMTSNFLLKSADVSDGFMRRCDILEVKETNENLRPFNNEFFKTIYTDDFLDRLFSVLVDNVENLLKHGMTEISNKKKTQTYFIENSDSIVAFINMEEITKEDLLNKPTINVYRDYIFYLREVGIDKKYAKAMNNFVIEMKEHFLLNTKRERGRNILDKLNVDSIWVGKLNTNLWKLSGFDDHTPEDFIDLGNEESLKRQIRIFTQKE